KKVGKGKAMYVLHKKNYSPSDAGKLWIPKSVTSIDIDATDDSDQIVSKIHNQLPFGSGGLFVLPVDQFFGAADKIITEAQSVRFTPTWWMVPDLRTSSGITKFGGYGVAQEKCGRFMAERVASIWTPNHPPIPDPPFVEIEEKHNDVAVSAFVAKGLNIPLKK